MKQKKATTAAVSTGVTVALFNVLSDDIVEADWSALWQDSKPLVSGVLVAAMTFLWMRIDKNRDGIPDVLQDDTADVP